MAISFPGAWFGTFRPSVVWVRVCVKSTLPLVRVHEWEGRVRRSDGPASFKHPGVRQEDCWAAVTTVREDLWDIGSMVYCGCSAGGG